MELRKCSNCGAGLLQTQSVCHRCGQSVEVMHVVEASKVNNGNNSDTGESRLFNNVGGKIKAFAKVMFWLEVLAAAALGIWCVFDSKEVYLLIALAGVFVALVSSCFVYGFGELIENVALIAENLCDSEDSTSLLSAKEKERAKKMINEGGWSCDCGRTNPSYTGTCVCGRTKK